MARNYTIYSVLKERDIQPYTMKEEQLGGKWDGECVSVQALSID